MSYFIRYKINTSFNNSKLRLKQKFKLVILQIILIKTFKNLYLTWILVGFEKWSTLTF